MNKEQTPQIVVRLRRTFWHDKTGIHQRTTLRYLKRRSKGFNFIQEDCDNAGTERVIPKIINLQNKEDGIYQIIPCNEQKDWETGHIDEWDYKLIPFPASPSHQA